MLTMEGMAAEGRDELSIFNLEKARAANSRSRLLRAIRRRKYTMLVGLLHPRAHQVKGNTKLNRYPEIFAAAAAAAPDTKRILSLGCSTGEECVTLANYFPEAQIVGADINPLSLLKAMKHRNDRIKFVYASDRILNRLGEFDALFCMSVLRSSRRYQMYYPFERFAERAVYLESLVRTGGLLIIHNSTYRFSDTVRRYAYETIPVTTRHDPVYLPDGVTEAKLNGIIFRRLSR
jgi:Methyltransferase domain